MGQTIELIAADGHRLEAYQAMPAGVPRGAVLVVQEIFGANDHIRKVADGFAAGGYVAIALALFDRIRPGIEIGYSMAEIQEGFGYKTASKTGTALRDIEAAVKAVATAGKVGVVEYCWGGFLAWMAAARVSGRSAAAPYYYGGAYRTPSTNNRRVP